MGTVVGIWGPGVGWWSSLEPNPLDCLLRAFSSLRFPNFCSRRRSEEVEWKHKPSPF